MARDVASNEVPRLTRPDGSEVGWRISGPPGLERSWRRGAARFRARHLPAMVAVYADGRRFTLDAGDVGYVNVYRLGEYEPIVTRIVRELLRPGDVAVDVGANHGWFSLVMAQATGGSGGVHAVEPLASQIPALQRNLELNPHLDVVVHEVAAGAADGELELHVFEGLPVGHTSAARLGDIPFRSNIVRRKRLDELVPDQPVLVKVDVEGYEPEVVSGATGWLARDPPMWVVEVNEETAAAFGRRPSAALAPLTGDDYSIFRVEGGGLTVERDVDHAPHGATWLCIPPNHADRLDAARRVDEPLRPTE